jgi:hypothetical protein
MIAVSSSPTNIRGRGDRDNRSSNLFLIREIFGTFGLFLSWTSEDRPHNRSVSSNLKTQAVICVILAGAAGKAQVGDGVMDPRVPDEVRWKAGYVNPIPPPRTFTSALLWGIAIADTRVSDYHSAKVEIAWTKLSCVVDGKSAVVNDDNGGVRGGLYARRPWFGSNDYHEPMPFGKTGDSQRSRNVVLRVGRRADRVWHFWSASPRAKLPAGKIEGCTVTARVKISSGALLQMGLDYWRSPTAPWAGSGVNNHEAGASNWYFPAANWQEVSFTDVGGPRF